MMERACKLFNFTPAILKYLNPRNAASAVALIETKFELVTYLVELGYDLAIGSGNNTSESPGFEKYGLFIKDNCLL